MFVISIGKETHNNTGNRNIPYFKNKQIICNSFKRVRPIKVHELHSIYIRINLTMFGFPKCFKVHVFPSLIFPTRVHHNKIPIKCIKVWTHMCSVVAKYYLRLSLLTVSYLVTRIWRSFRKIAAIIEKQNNSFSQGIRPQLKFQ